MVDRVVIVVLGRAEALVCGVMAGIALSEFDHKVAVEHGLPHLSIVTVRGVLRVVEAASPCLVEVVFALGSNVRQHLVDA
jgi:hypothetical protein